MTLKPLQDNVLLKPFKTEEKTEGGLYVPGTAHTSRYRKATVLAVGPGKLSPEGKLLEVSSAKVDDVVLYDSNYATEIDEKDEDGNKLVMCAEGCLLAKVE